MTIAVSERFKFLLNEFEPSNWTRFELEEFVRLKSSYTKEFYRRMKQFRSTGFWSINLDEFKRLMDIPVNYRMCNIDVKVLKPIQKELKEKYVLKIQNVDDFYEQNFNFNSMEHFENWFRKYVI